jgi:hypothetical protein
MSWLDHKRMVARNILHRFGPARRFKKFEASVHPQTWARHEELLAWAEDKVASQAINEAPQRYEASSDPIVRQGFELKQKVIKQYRNRYQDYHHLRILIHVPPAEVSSAYSSLCANFIQSFRFLGIEAQELRWLDSTNEVLERFRPTVLLTTDHDGYLSRIDWQSVGAYRKVNSMHLGLNASLQEYGNTPLNQRLDWAQENKVDFYYSFKTQAYVCTRYAEILKRGYEIFTLEFGANPLLYYSVPDVERDLNYVFLGSTNSDKQPRYYAYLGHLWESYPGYIDGPWWSLISRFGDAQTHRYLCARAKVALNLHIQNQIDWAGELNERTYNLAACGVPQLIDAPKLLSERFQEDSFFVAHTADEYLKLFTKIMHDPEEAQRRAFKAQQEVYAHHTVFHRAEQFIDALSSSRSFNPSGGHLTSKRLVSSAN